MRPFNGAALRPVYAISTSTRAALPDTAAVSGVAGAAWTASDAAQSESRRRATGARPPGYAADAAQSGMHEAAACIDDTTDGTRAG